VEEGVMMDKLKLIKELNKTQSLLKYQQKLGCNCSYENGKCNLCKQIEINGELIIKLKELVEGENDG